MSPYHRMVWVCASLVFVCECESECVCVCWFIVCSSKMWVALHTKLTCRQLCKLWSHLMTQQQLLTGQHYSLKSSQHQRLPFLAHCWIPIPLWWWCPLNVILISGVKMVMSSSCCIWWLASVQCTTQWPLYLASSFHLTTLTHPLLHWYSLSSYPSFIAA